MRAGVVAALVLMWGASPVWAVSVVFNGEVADTCDLSLPVPANGMMLMSPDHTILGSDQAGIPVVLTITSIGSNTITVGAPTLTDSPGTYDSSGQSLEIGYTGTGLLNLVNRPMGPGSSTFNAGILGVTLSTIVINARIVNENGFAQGDYQLTSVVTCS